MVSGWVVAGVEPPTVDLHPGWLMAFFILTEGRSGWGWGWGHSFPIHGCFETPLRRCRRRERGVRGLGPGRVPGIGLGLGLAIYIYCALPAARLYPIPSIMGLRGGGGGGVSSGDRDPLEMIGRGRLFTDVPGAWDGMNGAECGRLVVVRLGICLPGLDMHR